MWINFVAWLESDKKRESKISWHCPFRRCTGSLLEICWFSDTRHTCEDTRYEYGIYQSAKSRGHPELFWLMELLPPPLPPNSRGSLNKYSKRKTRTGGRGEGAVQLISLVDSLLGGNPCLPTYQYCLGESRLPTQVQWHEFYTTLILRAVRGPSELRLIKHSVVLHSTGSMENPK